jgi:hypothetical protein
MPRTDSRARTYDSRGKDILDVPFLGSKLRYREIVALPTLTGATVTITGHIPAKTWCWGVVVEILDPITGTLTTFDIGDGSDVDRWGAAIVLTAGTRTTSTSFTAANSFGFFTTTAVDVVLDADGANTFSGGSIRVAALISDITANARRGQFA